jgi:hypothetical protein
MSYYIGQTPLVTIEAQNIADQVKGKNVVLLGNGSLAKQIAARLLTEFAVKKVLLSTYLPEEANGNCILESDIASRCDSHDWVCCLANSFLRELLARNEQLVLPFSCVYNLVEWQFLHLGIERVAENSHFSQLPEKINLHSKYIVLFDLHPNNNFAHYLISYAKKLAEQGIEIQVFHPWQKIDKSILDHALEIWMWNGKQNSTLYLMPRLLSNYKVRYVESGYFPQNQHFYIDDKGINCDHSLMFDNLDWVSEKHFQKLEQTARTFFASSKPFQSDEPYIFIPLQVPIDSTVTLESNFGGNIQGFIDYACDYYHQDPRKLIFKAHPLDSLRDKYDYRGHTTADLPTQELVLGADEVFGINSTVLFEAVLAKKKVITNGQCLLNHSCGDMQKVLAALVSKQSHVKDISSDYLRHFQAH